MDWSTSEKQLPLHEIFRVEEMVAEIELNECWRKCEPHISDHNHIFWSYPEVKMFQEERLKRLKFSLKTQRRLLLGQIL